MKSLKILGTCSYHYHGREMLLFLNYLQVYSLLLAVFVFQVFSSGNSLWHSGLIIQHCCICDAGYYCGVGLISCLGTSASLGHSAPQNKYIELSYDLSVPYLGIFLKELKAGICIPMFIAVLFIVAKRRKQPNIHQWMMNGKHCYLSIQLNINHP